MKKILSLLAILMVAMTAWAIEPVAPTVGDGKEGSPYELGTSGNLVWFANQVNNGEISIHGKLTADIDLGDDQTMIGTKNNIFLGTFDGDGHTVTINYTATEDYTALFRYIGAATIKNLKTAGSITTGYCYAAGIAGRVSHPNSFNQNYDTYILNCASSVTITSTFTQARDANHGGITTYSADRIHLKNVIFNGKLLGENAKNCSGLVQLAVNVSLENCVFCPTEMTFNQSLTWTLVSSFFPEIKNCFYTKTLGIAQGTKTTAQAVASGELCYKLNKGKSNGSQPWYQNLDNGSTVDATPVPFKTHGTVYGGANQCPSGSYSNTYHPHAVDEYNDNGTSFCTKPDCMGRFIKPAKQDDSGTYIITNKGNLLWFAEQVNVGQTGINGKLYANIDLGDDQTMIGTSTNKYTGTFDGNGYGIKVNYTATEDVTALFRYVKNGTIKNLLTTGNINTNYINAAGVAGLCDGVTLEKVVSAVTINSTYNGKATHGGLVAETKTNNSSLTDCAFVGQLNGENTTNCAGLVGYHDSGSSLSLTSCYVAPSAEYTVNHEGGKTLARCDGYPSINYCCYTKPLGADQGVPIDERWVTDGVLVEVLNSNSSGWSQDPVLNVPVPYYLNTISSKNTDPLSGKYLKLTAIDAGEICINKTGTVNATLEYMSADIPIMWNDVEYGQNIQLTKGEGIYLRAKGENGRNATLNEGERNYLTFTSNMDVKASQNIMSLLDASCELKEVPAYAFYKLFDGCSHLTKAPDLPAVTLHSNSYEYMFRGCTKLTTIPDMSQVRLPNDDCYWACRFMFSDCSSLRVNTLGLGSEWKLQTDYTGTGTNHSFYGIFSGTGGNFTDTPQKDVVYYIYEDEPYSRTMTNEWGTVVLPFDVAYDADNTNHELYHLTAANSNYLAFTEFETSTIPAGTPMAVRAIGEMNDDGIYTISIPSAKGKFSGTIKEQTRSNASLPSGWTMTGTYSNLANKTGIYFIAQDKFWWAEDATTIPPFRAWFTGPVFASNTAKSLYIVIDDETTGIGSVNSEQFLLDASGKAERTVNNGKFIENGRVVVVKNGKKYNTQGQLLKD